MTGAGPRDPGDRIAMRMIGQPPERRWRLARALRLTVDRDIGDLMAHGRRLVDTGKTQVDARRLP